jgi:hypothetical protein
VAFNTARARTWLAAAWIFGCALYYYAHFSQVFVRENEAALRRVLPGMASVVLPDR